MLIGSIGKHRPYLRAAALLALEHNVSSVRRPGRKVIGPGIVRQLLPALGRDIHDVDILTARRARTILAIPTEGEKLPVAGP